MEGTWLEGIVFHVGKHMILETTLFMKAVCVRSNREALPKFTGQERNDCALMRIAL
jgi:hypothetical protein